MEITEKTIKALKLTQAEMETLWKAEYILSEIYKEIYNYNLVSDGNDFVSSEDIETASTVCRLLSRTRDLIIEND